MSTNSSIEWTENTWNPVTGCTKVSLGCKNCYAERMARRLQLMGQIKYRDGFKVRLHPECLDEPFHWRKPHVVFVNSMSDLFHEDVPFDFIKKVFKIMNETPHHTYQVLTKRAERMFELSPELVWSNNIWMGVSVETVDYYHRIDLLRMVPVYIKFLSLEPLLGPLFNINLRDIDWVVVGGESGPNARPMKAEWVKSIRAQCRAAHVPFFFKQWGGRNKKAAGRKLDGEIYNEMPSINLDNLKQTECLV